MHQVFCSMSQPVTTGTAGGATGTNGGVPTICGTPGPTKTREGTGTTLSLSFTTSTLPGLRRR